MLEAHNKIPLYYNKVTNLAYNLQMQIQKIN